jgi:CheY-like chemotaxis protein/two-component sensor histidine kinase
LKHDLDTDSPAHAIVADIENAAESATGLSRRLLDYTNPESKEAEQIDLANVVEEIISMVRGTIPPWIDLQSEVKSGEYFTTGDEMQLRQVVMNLVTNGLEAMEQSERGQLRVSVGRQTLVAQQLDAFDLSTAEPGPHVFVEVEDTGYGLSSEAREKLFDPFYTTKTEGRGFGMAIVSSIISAHSGAIKIDSTSSTGTRVRAVFPESLDQDASQFTPTDPDKPFVLVVDDDRFVRATLERLLRRIGYPSLVFERGAAAIDAVRRNEGRVRLLLLDLTIPGESARDTLKQVRAIGSDVRVVVTSGHEMSVVRERLEGVSFDAFLPKPFKATRLEEILGEFASESSQS